VNFLGLVAANDSDFEFGFSAGTLDIVFSDVERAQWPRGFAALKRGLSAMPPLVTEPIEYVERSLARFPLIPSLGSK
jgi:hypothetical protein